MARVPAVVCSNEAAVTASRSPSVTFSGYIAVENDVVYLFVASTTTATITIPSGWENPLGGTTDVESDAHQCCAVAHKVTAAEASGATTTYTATNLYDATETGDVIGIVIRGVDPADLFCGTGTTFNSTNTITPHVLASVTPDASHGLCVRAVAKDSTGTYTAPADHTRLVDGNVNCGVWMGSRNPPTVSGTAIAATNITPSAGDEYASISVCFKPADTAVQATDDSDRICRWVEALTEERANFGPAFTNHVSLILTSAEAASSSWLVLFACVHAQTTNSTVQANARLYHATAQATLAISSREPLTQTSDIEWIPFGGAVVATFGAAPGDQVFNLEHAAEIDPADSRMRDAVIVALKLESDDANTSTAGTGSGASSSTFVNAASLIFTPGTTGDYMLVGSFSSGQPTVVTDSNTYRLLLEDAATTRGVNVQTWNEIQDETSYPVAFLRNLASGASRTLRTQVNRAAGTGQLNEAFVQRHLTALRLSGFTDSDYVEDLSTRTSTSGTYAARNAASTLTFTPGAAGKFLVFGVMQLNDQGSGFRVAGKFVVDGTDYQEAVFRGAASGERVLFGLAVLELDANSTTIDWQMREVEASATAVESDFATVIALPLEVAGDQTGSFTPDVINVADVAAAYTASGSASGTFTAQSITAADVALEGKARQDGTFTAQSITVADVALAASPAAAAGTFSAQGITVADVAVAYTASGSSTATFTAQAVNVADVQLTADPGDVSGTFTPDVINVADVAQAGVAVLAGAVAPDTVNVADVQLAAAPAAAAGTFTAQSITAADVALAYTPTGSASGTHAAQSIIAADVALAASPAAAAGAFTAQAVTVTDVAQAYTASGSSAGTHAAQTVNVADVPLSGSPGAATGTVTAGSVTVHDVPLSGSLAGGPQAGSFVAGVINVADVAQAYTPSGASTASHTAQTVNVADVPLAASQAQLGTFQAQSVIVADVALAAAPAGTAGTHSALLVTVHDVPLAAVHNPVGTFAVQSVTVHDVPLTALTSGEVSGTFTPDALLVTVTLLTAVAEALNPPIFDVPVEWRPGGVVTGVRTVLVEYRPHGPTDNQE